MLSMAKKIDPLNKKNYGAASTMLTVTDIKAALNFYSKAFGFEKGSVMKGPDGKAMHAEMRLRGSVLMLGPENPERGQKTPKTLGGSPVTIYVMSEDVDKTFAKALKAGATTMMPVSDMFWGDRCGVVVDQDGYAWMVSTHVAEPTPQEMAKAMKEMAKAQAAAS